MTKIDNIKSLWKQIQHKTEFMLEASKEFKRRPNTLRQHWFGRFWTVPEDKEDEVITYMQNYIRLQNLKNSQKA